MPTDPHASPTRTITIPEATSFVEDVRLQCLQQLRADGYPVDTSAQAHTVITRFIEISRRRISRQPRQVLWSKDHPFQGHLIPLASARSRAVETCG